MHEGTEWKAQKLKRKRKASFTSSPSPSDNPTPNNARPSKGILLLKRQSHAFVFSGASVMAVRCSDI